MRYTHTHTASNGDYTLTHLSIPASLLSSSSAAGSISIRERRSGSRLSTLEGGEREGGRGEGGREGGKGRKGEKERKEGKEEREGGREGRKEEKEGRFKYLFPFSYPLHSLILVLLILGPSVSTKRLQGSPHTRLLADLPQLLL